MASSKTGLAFSGGGIRSAAFCSGVLRRLLERDIEVDYLSCVSGGGYTGTAFLDWKFREERKAEEDRRPWHDNFFKHMRERAGYFCHWEKPLEGILDTVILVCLVLLVNFIEPIIMWGSYACPVAFIVDFLFGKYLREKLDCDEVAAAQSGQNNASSPDQNATKQEIREHCLSRQGTDNSSTVILFSVLFLLFVFFFILAGKSSQKRFTTPLSFIHTTCAVFLALTFLPFAIHDFIIKIPVWTQYVIVVCGIMVWCLLPLLRSKTSYVLIIYLFSYVTYWKVYEANIVGFAFSSELFNRLLFISGFALWVVPLVTASHVRLLHVYNRWRLQKAFYHPNGLGTAGCAGIGLHNICPLWTCQSRDSCYRLLDENGEAIRSLSLEDLEGTKPEYISNIVVNRWQRDNKSEENYELLTMSPTVIERLDRKADDLQFQGKLEPKDVKLSDAMATSAAALSTHMGKYDKSVQGLTRLHTLLGLEMGATMISDIQSVKQETLVWKVLPFLVNILRGFPLISVPALYYSARTTESSTEAGVISFIVIHFLLAFIAVIDTGRKDPKWWERLARWFIVHNSFVHIVSEMFNKNNTGPMPPPIMLLSDGGHIENLALLPLLKKRLRKIIVVDGGYKHDHKLYGESLLNALMLARTKLNCSFLSDGGGDVISDLMETFVKPRENAEGKLPRYYKFKVRYDKDEFGNRSDGEVLLVTPRKPQEGVADAVDGTRSPNLHRFDEPDGLLHGMVLKEDDVDNLTFCCCECCHGNQCCGMSSWCCNSFPQHITANQFFTPLMFEAYHREGYRACVETENDDFMKNFGVEEQQIENAMNVV